MILASFNTALTVYAGRFARFRHGKNSLMKLRLLTLSLLSLLFTSEMLAQCPSGRIRNDATGSTRNIDLCTADGQQDEITFRTDFQINSNIAVIISDTRGDILASRLGQTFDFEGFANGKCRAFLVSFTGLLTATIGENVYSIDLSTDCFELSDNFIEIEHNAPVAGSITDNNGRSFVPLCVGDGSSDFVGYEVSGDDSDRYVYLITDINGNVEKVDYNDFEDFDFDDPGTSHIYGLAFNGDLRIRRGENIFTDELVDGCFDLTDDFITIERSEVDGGELRVDGEEHIVVDSTTSQAPRIDRSSSSTSPFTYVIIDRSSIIRGFSQGPNVDLSFLPAGRYFIYAYSFTGTLQAEVGQRLFNSGVRFASQCFRISDNAIVVTKETPATTTPACVANAGEIIPVASPVLLQNGIARVDAVLDGSSVVPSSYDSVFFLTRGSMETIVALSVASPSFSVNGPDTLTIFYLNAEVTDSGSPNFIDLSLIQFGVTTIGQFAASIMDSGVCADLTIPGAEVIVLPDPTFCNAFAGGSIHVDPTVELINGEATIEAIPDGSASIPVDAELTYILSQGFDQTIIALNDIPSFTVTATGQYAIHALAAETTDPSSLNFLDRSAYVSNSLTIFDAFDGIFAEGICADIELFGPEFQVTSGSSCAAFSGTVTATADTVDLSGPMVRISATPDGNAVIPTNFDRTYVLSFGPNKIVQAISAIPRFDVLTTGEYFIHAWVGEFTDPFSVDFVDLSLIRQGIAPVSDIILLIQGSGICSSIDELGTPIVVEQPFQTLGLQLRPIQVGDYLRIGNAKASQAQQGKLILTDQLGRVISSKSIQLSVHPQTFELEVLNAQTRVAFLTLIGAEDGMIKTQGLMLN